MAALEILRRRLFNQHLTRSKFSRPSEEVGWLGAVQAQDYPGAKWALGMRLEGASDDHVEEALNEGSILRTHLMRPTWHFVARADIRWMLALTAPRVNAVSAYYYRKVELDEKVFRRCNAAIEKALRGGHQLTRDELRPVLEKRGIATKGELRMGYIMFRAEQDGIVCSGARPGKQFTYALLDERAPDAKTLPRDEAMAELARRYFLSHGPATLQDFIWWSGQTVSAARSGIEAIKPQLECEGRNGNTYWFSESRPIGQSLGPVAYLMSIYDEYIIGYKDRSDICDDECKERLSSLGNALTSVIVVDGRIVGTWKRSVTKGAVAIETNLLESLSKAKIRVIAAAAERYGKFLGLPVLA